MTSQPEAPERRPTYLLADCGATTTTVALFDVIGETYGLVARATAPTTLGLPGANLLNGVRHAIWRISEATGRQLLTEQGDLIRPSRPNGAGVDHFGLTTSAAPPLRAVIAGLLEDVSVASARRALQTIYSLELDTFSLSDTRSEQEQLQQLHALNPDLILVAGGVDGGDTKRLATLLETLELGCNLAPGAGNLHLVYAGNTEMQDRAVNALSGLAQVSVVSNLRPTVDRENLTDTVQFLGDLYERTKIGVLPGMKELQAWSGFAPMPTVRAFAGMIEFFGSLYNGRVMGVDLGSSSVAIVAASPEQLHLSVRSDLGMGRPLAGLLDKVNMDEQLRWAPPSLTAGTLRDFAFEKSLYPYTVPQDESDRQPEFLLAQMVLQKAMGAAAQSWGWANNGRVLPRFAQIVVRGQTLCNSPQPGEALLAVLNAMQPTGIFSVVGDQYGILPALGLLAPHHPEAVVQILEMGALQPFGWVIAPRGRWEPGARALRVNVDSARRGQFQVEADFGELITVPLAPGEQAELTLVPERRVDLGFGPGQGKTLTVHGGKVGLVIDARGRPLQLPDNNSERLDRLDAWHTEVMTA